jgi:hypothetical protein
MIMCDLRKLIEKKKYWGFLSGRDALIFWRHVESRVNGSAYKWTQKDFKQLTRWQLGLPTTVQFELVAGSLCAPAPRAVIPVRPLLCRKYGTLAERQAARKAKEAARQASLRLQAIA